MKLILTLIAGCLLTGCATVGDNSSDVNSNLEYVINVINNRDFGFR